MRLLRNADSFEPRDAVKGDIARILFYMDLRYAGDDGVPDLALIDDGSNSGPLLGHLCTLLARNSDEPVDDLERRRHQRMVETQGNRNPFIDRPEFSRMLPISPREPPSRSRRGPLWASNRGERWGRLSRIAGLVEAADVPLALS